MPSNALPPLFGNTPDDHGSHPVALGYIGASITVLVALIRLSLTLTKKHGFRGDDYTFLAGVVFAFTSSITLERAVDEGLGRHSKTLNSSQLNSYTKLAYSTDLLSIFAQAFAKISVAFLYERIAPKQDRRGIIILSSCIAAWTVFAIFATALQCEGQVHWGAECNTKGYLQFPVLITNCMTDAYLAIYMWPRLWELQASIKDRALPIMLMGSRLLVCIMEIALIVYLGKHRSQVTYHSADSTWTWTTYWTINISITHMSVITATIPRINSFIADVQTRRAGLTLTKRDYENYKSSKSGSEGRSKNLSRVSGNHDLGPSRMLGSFRNDATTQVSHTIHARHPEEIEMDARDNIEIGSQSSLQRNAVYQKTEFRWEEEYSDAGMRGY